MKKTKTKKPPAAARIAVAIVFLALYGMLLVWVHLHICRIDGVSMEPSYHHGDVVYTELLKDGASPALGDVVILESPEEEDTISFLPWKTLLTKRIIGIPGDFIEIKEDGLYRNGDFLEEPYVASWDTASYLAIELKEDEYFVLGDNRDNSYDSRNFGPVQSGSIKRIVKKIIFGSGTARTQDEVE